MGKPAARITDAVTHPLPPVLTPGPGAVTVLIGFMPAWRGMPLAAVAALQAAKSVADAAIEVAESAAKAASATPGGPAARAAAELAKGTAAGAMGAAIGAASMGADMHACVTPWPVPPHGPGVVINGSPTVSIGFLPAARMGDSLLEAIGPPNKIVTGCMTVLIGDDGGAPGGGGLAGALAGAAVGAAFGAAIAGPVGALIGGVVGGIVGAFVQPAWRPLFGQEKPMSCGIASSRMVIATCLGKDVPEGDLRTQSQNYPGAYDPANGTGMGNLTELLRANGVANASEPKSGQTVTDLQNATAGGDPAIIHYNNPGGGGHFVVVDGVRTNPDGSRTVLVRDPWPPDQGVQQEMSEADFNNRGFSGWVVTTN